MALTLEKLNNGGLDLDHIAELATSLAEEATDRLGQTKKTWTGVLAELNASFLQTSVAISRAAAEDAAFQAQVSAASALSAKEIAQQFGGIYVDTAAALADAGLADGKYFSTPDGTTGGFLKLWRKLGGAALPGKVSVSSENFTDLNGDPRYSSATVDDSGLRANSATRADGTFVMSVAEIKELIVTLISAGALTVTGLATLARLTSSRFDIPTTDLDFLGALFVSQDGSELRGNMAFEADGTVRLHTVRARNVTVEGSLTVPSFGTTALTAQTVNGTPFDAVVAGAVPFQKTPVAEVILFPGYGQSLDTGVQAVPHRSTVQAYNALKFDGGVRPNDLGTRTGFLPLVETTLGILGETGATAAAFVLQYLLALEDGITTANTAFQPLMTHDGEGGKTITELMAPTYYGRVEASMNSGRSVANGLGKTFAVGPAIFNQGENNAAALTPRTQYTTLLEDMRLMLQATARIASGDAALLQKMLIAQTASHLAYGVAPNIPLAQWDANRNNPYVRIIAPEYILTYTTLDDIHMDAASQELFGMYTGVALKRWFFDRLNWRPLQPVRWVKQGNALFVEFNPVGEIEFDTTFVLGIANYGFELWDAVGASVAISSVAKVAANAVKIVGALPWTRYTYALGGTAGQSGRDLGARGNLRDRQGDTLLITTAAPGATAKALHNYCVMHDQVFA